MTTKVQPVSPSQIVREDPLPLDSAIETVNVLLTKNPWSRKEQEKGKEIWFSAELFEGWDPADLAERVATVFRAAGWRIVQYGHGEGLKLLFHLPKPEVSESAASAYTAQPEPVPDPGPGPYKVWVQQWHEYEPGWGVRPDGWLAYLTREMAVAATARQVAKEEGRPMGPSGYNFVNEDPYETHTSDRDFWDKVYEASKTGGGVWGKGQIAPRKK